MSFEDTVTRLEAARASEHAAINTQIQQVSDGLAEIRDLVAQLANQPELQARLNTAIDQIDADVTAMAADDEPAPPPAP